MNFRDFVLALLIASVIGSGIAVVYARQEHRQAYVQLNRLMRERDELNIEFSRLQLEQATWAETNRIEQIATAQLRMVHPDPASTQIVRR